MVDDTVVSAQKRRQNVYWFPDDDFRAARTRFSERITAEGEQVRSYHP
jgi:hypothetical protein